MIQKEWLGKMGKWFQPSRTPINLGVQSVADVENALKEAEQRGEQVEWIDAILGYTQHDDYTSYMAFNFMKVKAEVKTDSDLRRLAEERGNALPIRDNGDGTSTLSWYCLVEEEDVIQEGIEYVQDKSVLMDSLATCCMPIYMQPMTKAEREQALLLHQYSIDTLQPVCESVDGFMALLRGKIINAMVATSFLGETWKQARMVMEPLSELKRLLDRDIEKCELPSYVRGPALIDSMDADVLWELQESSWERALPGMVTSISAEVVKDVTEEILYASMGALDSMQRFWGNFILIAEAQQRGLVGPFQVSLNG